MYRLLLKWNVSSSIIYFILAIGGPTISFFHTWICVILTHQCYIIQQLTAKYPSLKRIYCNSSFCNSSFCCSNKPSTSCSSYSSPSPQSPNRFGAVARASGKAAINSAPSPVPSAPQSTSQQLWLNLSRMNIPRSTASAYWLGESKESLVAWWNGREGEGEGERNGERERQIW